MKEPRRPKGSPGLFALTGPASDQGVMHRPARTRTTDPMVNSHLPYRLGWRGTYPDQRQLMQTARSSAGTPGLPADVGQLVLGCEVASADLAGLHLEGPAPDLPRVAGLRRLHLDVSRGADIGAGAAADAGRRILLERGADVLFRSPVGKADGADPDDLLAGPDAHPAEDALRRRPCPA